MVQWSTFLQDRWYVLLIAVVVLVLVLKLVKTVVKWVLVLALAAAFVYYGVNYTDQLTKLKETVGTSIVNGVKDQAVKAVKDQAMKAVAGEAKEAKYTANPDGSYTVSTKSIKLEGKPGDNDVKVTFMGQSFTVKADETIQAFIEQAKKNP